MSDNGTSEEELVRFSLRLRGDLLDTIAVQAHQQGRSVNDLLNEVVGEYLEPDGNCRCCGKPL